MKILIADDHELFLDGLKLALDDLDDDIDIVSAHDYNQLLDMVSKHQFFDLILTDLAMPGVPWEEALKIIKEKSPEIPIVILSAVHDKDIVLQAVKMGASGFIPKTSSNSIILSAINLVLSGGIYLPSELLQIATLAEDLETKKQAEKIISNPNSILTPRQTEVLRLIGQGKPNKIIAHELGLSEGTVKLHVTAILKALNVNNRTGAVIAASKMGLTEIEENN